MVREGIINLFGERINYTERTETPAPHLYSVFADEQECIKAILDIHNAGGLLNLTLCIIRECFINALSRNRNIGLTSMQTKSTTTPSKATRRIYL